KRRENMPCERIVRVGAEKSDHRQRRLLRPRRERPRRCRAAEQRDELAASQIELHFSPPPARAILHDIEWAGIRPPNQRPSQGKGASGRTYLAGRSASTLTNRHLVTDAIG